MTLKSLAGIETPDRGRISVEGKVVYDSARKINWRPQKRKIGYLFQNYALFPNMSVETNIGAGLKKWGEGRKEAAGRSYAGNPGMGDGADTGAGGAGRYDAHRLSGP